MEPSNEDEKSSTDDFAFQSLWVRWDLPGRYPSDKDTGAPIDYLENLKFHDFCPIYPLDSFREVDEHRPPLQLASGILRLILRHIRWLVIFLIGGVFTLSRVDPNLKSPSALLPSITPRLLILIVLLSLFSLAVLVFWMIAEVTQEENLFRICFVYGPIILLSSGVTLTIYNTNFSTTTYNPNNIVYVSGYLLAIAVIGPTIYDTMIRAENMLSYFGQKQIADRGAYEEFREDMEKDLIASRLNVPLSIIFAFLISSQFTFIWWFGHGPQGLDSTTLLIMNIVIDFLLLIGIYKFIIILLYAHQALMDEYQTSNGILKFEYRPLHPDGYGGFHDIGKAAMRVNIIIILMGMYFGYRLTIVGENALPPDGFSGLSQIETVTWIYSYIGPLVLYAIVILCWIYFAFWRFHVKMVNSKRRKLSEFHNRRRASVSDGIDGERITPPPLGDPETDHEWQDIYDAPEWPVSIRPLASLVAANFAPIALSIINFMI